MFILHNPVLCNQTIINSALTSAKWILSALAWRRMIDRHSATFLPDERATTVRTRLPGNSRDSCHLYPHHPPQRTGSAVINGKTTQTRLLANSLTPLYVELTDQLWPLVIRLVLLLEFSNSSQLFDRWLVNWFVRWWLIGQLIC